MAVKSSDVRMSLSTILEHFTDQFVLIIKKICKLDEWTYVRIAGLPQKLQNQIPGLSRTFLGHFPGLFQDCLRFFLQDLKFNFDYYSHAPTLLYL